MKDTDTIYDLANAQYERVKAENELLRAALTRALVHSDPYADWAAQARAALAGERAP